MGDYLDSPDTNEQAIQRVQEVVYVCRQEGFEMCNLMSSFSKVLDLISPSIVAPKGTNLTLSSAKLHWRWVPTKEYIVDKAIRTTHREKLQDSSH